MTTITAIKGMNDILPTETPLWQAIEHCFCHLVESYGYQEIRTPIVEKTQLFIHAIGEMTDVVEKEMYCFTDKGDENITLRPEGTAGVLRAMLENNLLRVLPQKVWYKGPMFRYERPQKGRSRQFHHLGVEVYGAAGPDIDAELLLMVARLWKTLGLEKHIELQINSLGLISERNEYRVALINYFENYLALLDEESKSRLHTNPLRILDSKNPALQTVIANSPKLFDFLGDETRAHFAKLCEYLQAAGLAYTINPRLVRGLDYYGKTVFEWVTTALGAQGTVCGGGRYDDLVSDRLGSQCSALGFAIGVERLALLLQSVNYEPANTHPHVYLITVGAVAEQRGLLLAEELRTALPTLRVLMNVGGGNFKSQFKRADRSQAMLALILGEEECAEGTVGVKNLRVEMPQQVLKIAELITHLQSMSGLSH